jgi:glucosamine--fructose-6-phosphate aminotransferase (isomerizing)
MCGIVGAIAQQGNVTPFLLDGLKRLEYRGYDSAGFCVIGESGRPQIFKQAGKISELAGRPEVGQVTGDIGIAHTRWATHGAPTAINAHPHFDCSGQIAIVHNGIIENYQSLKQLLINEGHKIISDTDSEIIAHLIEKFYQPGQLEAAVAAALKLVEGTYGLAILHAGERKIVAARKGSPLVIGIGDAEMLVASDVSALISKTNKVIYLNDGEIATLTDSGCDIHKLNGDRVDGRIEEVLWSIEQIAKGNFKHFMLKEIFEQPEAIANTLRGRLKNGRIQLTVDVDIQSLNRIVIVACGTSWHAGLIGKYLIEQMTGIPVEVDYASEFRYRDPIIGKRDLLVVISQSGETADTLAALRLAKVKQANVVGLINVVGSTIAREVKSGIYLHAGPEIGVASTKALSCQVTALILLGLYLKQLRGEQLDTELLQQLERLPQAVAKTLEVAPRVQEVARQFAGIHGALYLGRGLNFPVGLEGALKLKEISYIHAEGYPSAEMKHGPIALIDEQVAAIFVAPHDELYEKNVSNIQEILARQGRVMVITDQPDERLSAMVEQTIVVPRLRDELMPIINVIPLQLLAYYIADAKGLDVDKPRNLAKSVTVE